MTIQFSRLSSNDWFAFNKLQTHQISYVQRLIDEATSSKIDYSQNLAGNISESLMLEDHSNFVVNNIITDFLKNTEVSPVLECTLNYKLQSFPSISSKPLKYSLEGLWVNLQKRYEFNPIHDHHGLLSFVIWMQIPYDLSKEHSLSFTSKTNQKVASCFSFIDCTGNTTIIPVDKSYEGVMCLFPSTLKHLVYPFYTSEDFRISVSGNITLSDI